MGAFALLSVADARPQRNAFLNKAAPNLRMIIRQVKFDPEVCSRYERHFGLSKWQIVAYFETLRLARLKESASYIVYNCGEKDDVIRSRVFHLKKGTKVYIDRFDQPVLKFSCGNPMSRGPVRLLMSEVISEAPVAPPVEAMTEDQSLPIEPEMPRPEMVAEELTVPAMPTPPSIPTNPPTIPTPEPPTIVKPSFEGPPTWIAPLFGGALIVLNERGDTRPPVVPEPSTVVATLAGFAYLARTRRKAKGAKAASATTSESP